MAIFRGTGGAGSSDSDATLTAVTAQAQIATTKASEANAYAISAKASLDSFDELYAGVTPLTAEQSAVLGHFTYDDNSRKIKADRAIETTLNSLYLGEQHKMSSGAENIFFSNQSSNIDFFPMWGGMRDQSNPANQGASGVISPSGRIYDDMTTIQLRGTPVAGTAVAYNSGNTFVNNTAGLGIKTRLAETIDPTATKLEYRLTVGTLRVYVQELILDSTMHDGEDIQWWFDHPVEIFSGTTIVAAIHKLGINDDVDHGYLQVQAGDDGTGVYWAELYNRVYRDEDLELISPYLKYQAMDFSLDSSGTTIVFTNQSTGEVLQPHPVNFLKAINNSGNIQVKVKDGAKILIEGLPVSGSYISNTLVNSDTDLAVNQLNALFTQSGGATGQVPVITSSSAVTMQQGDTLNYELTATNGVAYEWSNLPQGITTVEGHIRKLIGGSGLAQGTYTITAKAINYYGVDTETLTLTVTAPAFSSTKSVDFQQTDYMGANANLLDSVLGRVGNGSGSSEAWSISLWFKGGTASSGQTVFYFGSNDTANGGYIELRYIGSTDKFRLRYGSTNNQIQQTTPSNSVPANTWKHIVVTYDGGTTGASSGSLSNYYSRFKIYIDGTLQTTSNSHVNYGWSSGLTGVNLRVGKLVSGNTMLGCRIHNLAVWDSDQSGNVSDIYNNGASHNLEELTTSPSHWWRMGDGDTYPTIQDNVGTAHFVMYNMTAANIVSDAP